MLAQSLAFTCAVVGLYLRKHLPLRAQAFFCLLFELKKISPSDKVFLKQQTNALCGEG